MEREKVSGGNFLLSLIGFTLAAATGCILLVATLVVWISGLTGSMIAATLIVGALCFLLALAIYQYGIRQPLRHVQEQIDTVYEVSRLARDAYDWVSGKVTLLLRLVELFRQR